MKVIEYNGSVYPHLQEEGFASSYAFPFAKKICKGTGLDIGPNKSEWALPGAQPIDLVFDDPWDAMHLPEGTFDYIFSSHCLEHIEDWVGVLDYWKIKLKGGGILFLYLPHYDQKYWRPWNNRKHIHAFYPSLLKDYFIDRGWNNIFVTEGYDLNHSFYAVAENL